MQITKEELRKMYNSMTNIEVCKELDITTPTLVKYLNSAGIALKGKGNKMKKKKVTVI